ncbi:PAS domain S-box protein, partial [candidate division WOR-3 bacterium]|nr:PAS domain S-box protein [candidate division WOR-3 bacterium]
MKIILNNIKISDKLIRRIDVLSLQGNVIISTDNHHIGKNYANNKIFNKSVKYDNVELITLDDECNIVNILSGPIYCDNECIGVLIVYISTDEFSSILNYKLNIGKIGYTTLIKETDRKGILIISNRYHIDATKRFYFTNENKLEEIYAVQIDEKKHEIIETIDYSKNKIITIVDYIDYCNIFISVRYSKNEVTNIFSYVNKMFYTVIILLFTFLIFLVLIIYKQIISPLKKIVTFVKKINSNIKPNILKVNYKNEFGELGSGLNKMGDILTANINELKIVRQKHDLLITGIEQIEECFLITDENGIIKYVNPAFQKVTGYSGKELEGEKPRILENKYHDKKLSENIWGILMSGKTWKGVFTNKRKNGEEYKDESTITPIKDSAGKIIAFIILKKDVTQKEKMENQQRQSEKMITIGKFASGIAHDFNNVL